MKRYTISNMVVVLDDILYYKGKWFASLIWNGVYRRFPACMALKKYVMPKCPALLTEQIVP